MKRRVKVKRVILLWFILAGTVFAQFFSGNQGDVPVPMISDNLSFNISGFGGTKLKEGYYTDERYKGILPPFGVSIGATYRNMYFNLGYSMEKNLELTFQHTVWNNEKFFALWGINGLLLPDIESEGTEYIPEDSSSKILRIPLFAEFYAKPLRFFEAGVGLGLGKYAQNKYLEQPLKLPGVFISLSIKPVDFIRIFWEGYTSTWKRNLGISIGPFKGIEFFSTFRYCAYPPDDKFYVHQGFFGVRAEIPSETVFKPAISEVRIIAKEQATGKPIKGAKIESTEGKFPSLISNENGEILTALKPGLYPVKISANSKYNVLNTVLEVPQKQKSVTFEVKLRYSKEYVDYTTILDRARELVKKNDVKNAEIELTKALKLFPDDADGLKLRDSVLTIKSAMISDINARADNYLRNKRYQDAIYELQRIFSFDEGNEMARKRIDSIRVVMLEERKKTERPAEVPQITTPPAAKPKPAQPEEKVSVPELVDRGKKLFFEGKYREAKSYFERALKVEPGNKEARFYLEKCDSYIKMMGK